MKDMTAIDPELVSVKTLARLLDISEKTIWDWIYKSRRQRTLDPIPYHKLGGLVRFSLREIRAWVDRRKVRPLPCLGRG
jgi:predicted DNA-binding transcriptional regulator AlpA